MCDSLLFFDSVKNSNNLSYPINQPLKIGKCKTKYKLLCADFHRGRTLLSGHYVSMYFLYLV